MSDGLPLPEWLLRWLSVDVEALEGGSASLRLARFPEGELGLLALLAVIGALGLVAFTYAYGTDFLEQCADSYKALDEETKIDYRRCVSAILDSAGVG